MVWFIIALNANGANELVGPFLSRNEAHAALENMILMETISRGLVVKLTED